MRELYECYLFHYEKQFSTKIERTELLDFKKVIQNLKPEYVQEVKIFQPSEIDIFSEDDLINVIDNDNNQKINKKKFNMYIYKKSLFKKKLIYI